MKPKFTNTILSAFAAIAIYATTPAADAGMFIKFDGVDGESKDADHDKWIDVLSFCQGLSTPGGGATGATRRRGAVVMEDIACSKELDKSSPKIAEAVCKGKVFPKVEIHLTSTYGGDREITYLKYELTNVMVTGYKICGQNPGGNRVNPDGTAGEEEVPTEDFALNFEEIKVTYTENDSKGKKKGNVEYSWKVEEGES
jgi:type VI secretion system secreted protein Hcp